MLKMGFTLGLPLDQLVVEMQSPMAPVVSYRKKMNRKTRDSHFDKDLDMAKWLEQLVDFCPFDNLVQPPTLKNPVVEYHYLQKVSSQIRKDLDLGPCDLIAPKQIIQKFIDLEVIITPVLWGSDQNHGNALTHLFGFLCLFFEYTWSYYIHMSTGESIIILFYGTTLTAEEKLSTNLLKILLKKFMVP